MKKTQDKLTLSDRFIRNNQLVNCSKIVNRMSFPEVRVLLFIEDHLNNHPNKHIFHEEENLHNSLLLRLANHKDRENNRIDFQDNRLDLLVTSKANKTLPIKYFEWILSDLRSSIYLGAWLLHSGINIPALNKSDYLEFLSLMVRVGYINIDVNHQMTFQLINYNLTMNTDLLLSNIVNYRLSYSIAKVKHKTIKWIDQKNEFQIDWLYNYLIDAGKVLLQGSFVAVTSEEKYAQILASLDFIPDLPSTADSNLPPINKEGKLEIRIVKSVREYYLTTMKNAWNGQAYRKDKMIEKSECQITTTQENFAKLNALAKRNKKLPNKIINELIANEYKEIDWEPVSVDQVDLSKDDGNSGP